MIGRRHFISSATVKLKRKDRLDEETLADQRIEDLEAVIDPAVLASINEDADVAHREVRVSNIKGRLPYAKILYQKIENVEIGTTETEIGHSLGKVPMFYHVNRKNTGYYGSPPDVWETRVADQAAIYLQADMPVFVDVIVRG